MDNKIILNLINVLVSDDDKTAKLAYTLLDNLDLNITENSIFLCNIISNIDYYDRGIMYGFRFGKYFNSIISTEKHELFIENFKILDNIHKYGEILEKSKNNPILSEIIKRANKYDTIDFLDDFECKYTNFCSRNRTLLDFSDEELLEILKEIE